jgi:tRNA A-37 threonylcarbamoyl transferase component Bud32
MAKIHIENGIISSSADYGLYHGTSEIAKVEASGLRVQGDVTAENLIVSSSVTFMTQSFSSGSTIFGDTGDDTHQFTGSLKIQSGSIDITSTQSPNYGMRFVTSAGHQYFKIRKVPSSEEVYNDIANKK